MDIIYDYATEDDGYGISYVSAHSWKETYKGLLPEEYLDDRISNINNKIESTKKFLKTYNGKYIVAKDKDKIIGILAYSPQKQNKYKEYGHLGALYVLKSYQKKGIGKNLFKIAIEGLIEMGYKKMQLECMCGNKTINFYKKYMGIIESQINYPINNVGIVKADIVLFEDLEKTLEILNKTKKTRHF